MSIEPLQRYERRLLAAATTLGGQMQLSGLIHRLADSLKSIPNLAAAGIGALDDDRGVVNLYCLDMSTAKPERSTAAPAAAPPSASSPELADADLQPVRSIQVAKSEIALFQRDKQTVRSMEVSPAGLDVNPALPSTIRRYISAPMLLEQRPVGILFAGLKSSDPIPPEAESFVADLARVAAPVLWNCFTHQRFARGDRRRDTLVALSNSIYTSLEFDSVIQAACAALRRLDLGAPSAINLFEPDGVHCLAYWIGHPTRSRAADAPADKPPPPERINMKLTAFNQMMKDGGTFDSGDIIHERGFVQDRELRSMGVRSYIATAMQARGRLIGALLICSPEPLSPLKMDVWLYENMAMQLGLAIDNAIQHQEVRRLSDRLNQQNVYLREEIHREHDFSEMIGDSGAMRRVLSDVQRVAPTDATVLITGETGVGKELVARALHAAGGRAGQPMVKVNCAAIPEGIVESELFGHERGAFTSAVERRIGRFELAIDGTLFLDEVGELPLPVQAKLLRVLQDGEFERVGGTKTLRTNARIIAATNRDLLRSVESGTFRRDLYYRLNVFPLNVPPLSERREDIPILVDAFVAQFSRRTGKRIDSVDGDSLADLSGRDWPGNIRELQHVIERAMILCEGKVLYVDRPPRGHGPEFERAAAGRGPSWKSQSALDARNAAPAGVSSRAAPAFSVRPGAATSAGLPSLDWVKAEHICRALEQCEGIIDGPRGAARALGLKPSTLRYQIKRLGLVRTTNE